MSSTMDKVRRAAALRPAHVRAMIWANRSLSRAREDLAANGTRATVVPPPAGLPHAAMRDVRTVLNLRRATCLERSLVLQRWLAAHGFEIPVVIGVRNGDADFAAHAWLPGFDLHSESVGYTEIKRIAP